MRTLILGEGEREACSPGDGQWKSRTGRRRNITRNTDDGIDKSDKQCFKHFTGGPSFGRHCYDPISQTRKQKPEEVELRELRPVKGSPKSQTLKETRLRLGQGETPSLVLPNCPSSSGPLFFGPQVWLWLVLTEHISST